MANWPDTAYSSLEARSGYKKKEVLRILRGNERHEKALKRPLYTVKQSKSFILWNKRWH